MKQMVFFLSTDGFKRKIVTTMDFNAYEPYFFLASIYHVVALLNMAFLSI
jgi:hypothetical protein